MTYGKQGHTTKRYWAVYIGWKKSPKEFRAWEKEQRHQVDNKSSPRKIVTMVTTNIRRFQRTFKAAKLFKAYRSSPKGGVAMAITGLGCFRRAFETTKPSKAFKTQIPAPNVTKVNLLS